MVQWHTSGRYTWLARQADEGPVGWNMSQCSEPAVKMVQQGRDRIMTYIEAAFYKHGVRVARHPWLAIIISLLVTLISLVGLVRFQMIVNYVDTWVPSYADSKVSSDWLAGHFPPEQRSHTLIVTADNILTPGGIQALHSVHKRVEATVSADGSSWWDHCRKVPALPMAGGLPAGGLPAGGLPTGVAYCRLLESSQERCLELSILQLFSDVASIGNITESEVLDIINDSKNIKVTRYLGGISYSPDGRISGASATAAQFFTTMNSTEALMNPVAESPANPTSLASFQFEVALLASLLDQSGFPPGVDSSASVDHSMSNEISQAFSGVYPLLAAGFVIMFFYILLMLGKWDVVEHRAWLTLPALINVLLGTFFSFGVCSAVGLAVTNFHPIVPLILLAIGIDDAFVVVGALDNQKKDEKLEEKFGAVMKQAGVSISITSITDIVAFATGASSSIPGISSFCVHCSVGLAGIFFFTVTFFLGALVLKQRHVDSSRDGCWPAYTRKTWSPSVEDGKFTPTAVFRAYSSLLMKTPARLAVLGMTLAVFTIGVWGCCLVEQRFNPPDILNKGYLTKWFNLREQYFEGEMETSAVFITDMSEEDFVKAHKLVNDLRKQSDIVSEVSPWTKEFIEFVNSFPGEIAQTFPESSLGSKVFHEKLGQFLFSPTGALYRPLFTFSPNSSLQCGSPAPAVLLATLPYSHTLLKKPTVYIEAMNGIKDMVKAANMSGYSFPYSETYFSWETDEALRNEFPRNMSMSLVSIFVLTLVCLMDLKLSSMVIVCVVLSLVNMIGFGHFWGLTFNLYTSSIFTLATGLYVDYSVHVAYSFSRMTSGHLLDKIIKTLTEVGPAVFHGGMSTFLATSVLAVSTNYTWRLFFKSFMMVTFFGLFHGLVFLPVMLSFTEKPWSRSQAKVTPKDDIVVVAEYVKEKSLDAGEEDLARSI